MTNELNPNLNMEKPVAEMVCKSEYLWLIGILLGEVSQWGSTQAKHKEQDWVKLQDYRKAC